jgi:hypothetical protein
MPNERCLFFISHELPTVDNQKLLSSIGQRSRWKLTLNLCPPKIAHRRYWHLSSVGCGQLTKDNHQYLPSAMVGRQKISIFFKKNLKMTPPHTQIIIESNRPYLNTQSQFNSTIEATIQSTSLNISMEIVVWLVGMAASTAQCALQLARSWMTERWSMLNLNHLKNIKINIKTGTWETQMTENIPELQEVN